MKKHTLLLALVCSFAVSCPAYGQIGLSFNDVPVSFTDSTGRPIIDENGRTLVPLRASMESMGCTVNWYEPSRTAFIETAFPFQMTLPQKSSTVVFIFPFVLFWKLSVLLYPGMNPSKWSALVTHHPRQLCPMRNFAEWNANLNDWNARRNWKKCALKYSQKAIAD